MSSHRLKGRQLSRDTEHRLALRRNLIQSLFEHGAVRTTLPKAKEVQPLAERLITLARRGTLTDRRHVVAELNDRRLVDENQDFITEGNKTVVQKLFKEIAPKFVDRKGGYTRITKTADYRIGDAADIVILQLILEDSKPQGTIRRAAGLRRKRNERKHAFAGRVLKARKSEASPTATAEASAST